MSAISIVLPEYGTSQSYFSASLPFVEDGVFLKIQDNAPFIASYELYADIVQPIGVVDLKTTPITSATNNTDDTSNIT